MSSVESQFHISPFPPFPSAERYVRVGSQDEALQRVCRSVEAWEAISLVIGPPGTGKSLLCRMVKNHFANTREVIVFGDAMLENPISLQRHLLSRLDRIRGISQTKTGYDDPQLAIIDRIANSSKEFAGLLLLVDEAQDLSPETLETIRILTNTMTHDGRPRVSAVLAGGPKLDETLALPSLEALVQRVATRCYMHPLSSDETVHYVREVLRKCGGWDENQIEDTAIRSIHRACSGVPRLINQLMTASVEFAQSRGRNQLTGQTVDQAWAILQQLPSPILDEPELTRPVHAVEFGPLQDECEHRNDDFDMLEFEPSDEPATCVDLADNSDECESDLLDLASLSMDCQTVGSFDYDATQYSEYLVESPTPLYDPFATDDHGTTEPSPKSAEPAFAPKNEVLARRQTTASMSKDLFGDFDEEEPVETSVSTLSFNPVARDELSGEKIAATQAMPKEDIETSLHREVISLRGAASAPVLWIEDDEAGEMLDDDRDLLVIEDDVAVDGAKITNQVEKEEPAARPMAVDFQSMLAKMRSPGR